MITRYIKSGLAGSLGCIFALACVMPADAGAAAQPAKAWRLGSAVGSPEWLDFGVDSLLRYESLDKQFRTGRAGSDQILLLRTLLKAEIKADNYGLVAELIDARQELADSGTPISTSFVDTFDILQAYASLKLKDLVSDGSATTVQLGRQTLDLGSRRLVARNRFRATMNAFDGVDIQWKSKGGTMLNVFYFMPVNRTPSAAADLLDNKQDFDESNGDTQFWGVFASIGGMPLGGTLELYVMGLEEKDSASLATADRSLYTPGFRFFNKAGKGKFDFEIENMVQTGQSRASTKASDTKDLDTFAWSQHLGLGYTFDMPCAPRLSLEYDYASGDEDPADDEYNRFSTLYGVGRADFGPTSLWNAFSRANIISPALRLGLKPAKALDIMLCDRFCWLASETDSWVGGKDAGGNSGTYIGNQIEGRFRWDAVPGNVQFEFGFAYLFAGEFMHDAPNSPDQGDAFYTYAQISFKL
ncbi:MAG: alginate export family protein [Opitutales bacterium]|jgi:hypothetical protein